MSLGEAIRITRQKAFYTQEDFAKNLEVALSTVNRWELNKAKPNMKIMHPLPRVNEIAYDVDDNPHAYYIQQAKNGLFAREAIYCHCLGITLDEIRNDKTIIE